jgi:hypothetical protein
MNLIKNIFFSALLKVLSIQKHGFNGITATLKGAAYVTGIMS